MFAHSYIQLGQLKCQQERRADLCKHRKTVVDFMCDAKGNIIRYKFHHFLMGMSNNISRFQTELIYGHLQDEERISSNQRRSVLAAKGANTVEVEIYFTSALLQIPRSKLQVCFKLT